MSSDAASWRAQWKLERRASETRWAWPARIGAIVIGLTLGLAVLQLVSKPEGSIFHAAWSGVFAGGQTTQDISQLATPLILTGVAAAVCGRMRLWNIGIEGQLFMGAWAATGISIAVPHWPGTLLLTVMLAASATAGALWVLLPALARAYLGVNEVITTLLFNFIATLWVSYFASGVWNDPQDVGQVSSVPIPKQTQLPTWNIAGFGVYAGFVIAVGVAVFLWALLRFTTFGYQLRIAGASQRVGRYAGLHTRRLQLEVFLISGAVGGLAGGVELTGVVYRMTSALSDNYGYIGIAVAVIAGFSMLGTIPVALVLGAVSSAGISLTIIGVNEHGLVAVSGFILLLVAIGEVLARYRVRRIAPGDSNPALANDVAAPSAAASRSSGS